MKYFAFFVGLILIGCTEEKVTDESIEKKETGVVTSSGFSHRVEFKENLGWGYQIFDGSKLILNQDHIPAIQGNIGFPSKEAADKTAKYIIQKLENDIFPPTLTVNELDSLEVLPVN